MMIFYSHHTLLLAQIESGLTFLQSDLDSLHLPTSIFHFIILILDIKGRITF